MPYFHKWLSCGQGESQPICKGTWRHLTLHRRLEAPSSYPSLACLQLQSQSLHCFPSLFFSLSWKKSICPPSHILSCLPTAPHCPKGGGFFCVDWLCLVSLQSLLCALLLWEAASASHWLCLLQPSGVCRPSTPHYIHPSPINDTSHIDPKKQRVFTRPRAQTACGFLFNKATAALGNHS